MIETKEQYERLVEIGEHGTHAGAIHLLYAMETIEALREVAREAKYLSPIWKHEGVDKALDALPDWITEDG